MERKSNSIIAIAVIKLKPVSSLRIAMKFEIMHKCSVEAKSIGMGLEEKCTYIYYNI